MLSTGSAMDGRAPVARWLWLVPATVSVALASTGLAPAASNLCGDRPGPLYARRRARGVFGNTIGLGLRSPGTKDWQDLGPPLQLRCRWRRYSACLHGNITAIESRAANVTSTAASCAIPALSRTVTTSGPFRGTSATGTWADADLTRKSHEREETTQSGRGCAEPVNKNETLGFGV
jgi:hypothetical protein